SSRGMRVAVVAILLSAAIATPARAAGSDDEERARGHYEIGLGLYRLGDYRGALEEFAAGYELARKPGFLLNLGQTYRKLGELPRRAICTASSSPSRDATIRRAPRRRRSSPSSRPRSGRNRRPSRRPRHGRQSRRLPKPRRRSHRPSLLRPRRRWWRAHRAIRAAAACASPASSSASSASASSVAA